MNLEQEFNEETGRESYNTVNCCYDGYYVEWLEERIKKLTIPVVVVAKRTLCDCEGFCNELTPKGQKKLICKFKLEK